MAPDVTPGAPASQPLGWTTTISIHWVISPLAKRATCTGRLDRCTVWAF